METKEDKWLAQALRESETSHPESIRPRDAPVSSASSVPGLVPRTRDTPVGAREDGLSRARC